MSNTKIGIILVAVSIYLMVLVPILMDPNPIAAAALWTMIYLLGCITVLGTVMIIND